MSNDISTSYTKIKNQNEGRKGYFNWKREKAFITPKEYGIFRLYGRRGVK